VPARIGRIAGCATAAQNEMPFEQGPGITKDLQRFSFSHWRDQKPKAQRLQTGKADEEEGSPITLPPFSEAPTVFLR